MDASDFKDVFAAEAEEYLQALNRNLLTFENDPENSEILNEMFRAAHSLKGMSGTMGYQELANFTHQMESVLDLLRAGELSTNKNINNLLFASLDTLEVLLEKTLLEEEIPDVSQIENQLKFIVDNKMFPSSADVQNNHNYEEITKNTENNPGIKLDEFDHETIMQGMNQGFDAFEISVTLRPRTLLKSVRVYTIFQALEEIGTIIKCDPSAQDLEDERFDLDFSVVILTQKDSNEVAKIVESISEVQNVSVKKIILDQSDTEIMTRKTDKHHEPEQEDETAATTDEYSDSDSETNSVYTSITSSIHNRGVFADKFIRVETDRLDELVNLMGELVISKTQVIELATHSGESDHIKNTLVQLDRLTTDLQYSAMKLRMVPIKQVFDRFPRMVRDLSKSHNKDINLELTGEETELDRSIVNLISDPLVHLIRNSIDHGIETKTERIKLGKPIPAQLRLSAYHQGSHILIEVFDDGRGIDVDKIAAAAKKRNLLPKDFDGQLSTKEAINLIFTPGFSTSDAVTDISGRGVGMDAVRSTVESLSGQVDMDSTPGEGSCITIKLPLTLAIIKALLVLCQGQTYAIPIQAVRENLIVTDKQVKTISQQQVIVIRDEVLPLVDLAESLGFPSSGKAKTMSVIVTESQGEKIGLIVDDLIGQQEIVIKSLSKILGDIPGIGGAAILGNGKVALILDQSTLIKGRSEAVV